MPEPKNTKEVRVLCGMISSLASWFPDVQFNTANLRAACAENKKFQWNEAMANEFKQIKHIFKSQIRLSPLDPSKRINIMTDGANSQGIGFVLFQNGDDRKVGKDIRIIKANSSALKSCQKQYSAIDTELLALKFACESSYFPTFLAPEIHIYTDSSGLEGMFNKTLDQHKNLRIRAMIEKLAGYSFTFHHIGAEENKIADCLSRLTRNIREAEHFSLSEEDDIRLADEEKVIKLKKVKSIKTSEIEEDDEWVEYLGNVAMMDADYLSMIHHLEAGSKREEISKECELSSMHNHIDRLSVHTLKGGQVLILHDKVEILIPSRERNNILNLAHAENHRGVDAMTRQLRGKVFWQGMNAEAKELVRKCESCQRNARSHHQDTTEISNTNM